LVGILSAVLSFFRLLHPASFDRYDSNWEKGNYSMIISGDIPDLLNEIGERFWYEWWYEYGFRQSYEEWKQDQLEEAMGANEDEE
jgi:hypothetical protein